MAGLSATAGSGRDILCLDYQKLPKISRPSETPSNQESHLEFTLLGGSNIAASQCGRFMYRMSSQKHPASRDRRQAACMGPRGLGIKASDQACLVPNLWPLMG